MNINSYKIKTSYQSFNENDARSMDGLAEFFGKGLLFRSAIYIKMSMKLLLFIYILLLSHTL